MLSKKVLRRAVWIGEGKPEASTREMLAYLAGSRRKIKTYMGRRFITAPTDELAGIGNCLINCSRQSRNISN